MNLKFLAMTIVIICLSFLMTQVIANCKSILKQIVISIIIFIIEYYLFSIILLWLDRFEVRYVLIVTFLIDFLFCICWRKKISESLCNIDIHFSKSELAVLGILILLLPFICVKSQDVRTSSDMGMYFEWTVKLTGDNTSVSRQLNEIGQISNTVDEGIYNIQQQLQGIYIREESADGNIEYDYHAIPTWVTLMALFAKIFGIYYASHVLTLLYIIAVLCCFFTCENIGIVSRNKYLSIIVFALSPIILYVSKATLTEMAYISMLFCSLFCISEPDKNLKFISAICFGMLSFIHLSNYMYVFAIYAGLLYLAISLKEKIYGVINLINILMFTISLFYANFISRLYTHDQLLRFRFLGDDLNEVMIGFLIILFCCVAVQVLELLLNDNILNTLIKVLKYIVPKGLIVLELIIIVGIIIQGYYLGFTDKYIIGEGTWHLRDGYANRGIESLSYLNITNILRATSYIWVPIIFIYNIFRKDKDNVIQNALLFVFFYSMFIYTYIQIDTPTNYYASRYLAMMIIPGITLLAATIIDKKNVFLLLSTWSLIYCLRYDYNFLFRGSFMGQYQILQDTIKQIPYGAVVLVQEENAGLNQILVNNLREMNGNLVYNFADMDEVQTYYSDQDIYVISSEKCNDIEQLLLYKSYDIMGNLSGEKGRYMKEYMYTYDEIMCIYIAQ